MSKKLTIKEASSLTGVTVGKIYAEIKSGELIAEPTHPMTISEKNLFSVFPTEEYLEHKDSMIKSLKQENEMLNAKILAKDYVSPTMEDIKNAGEDWNKGDNSIDFVSQIFNDISLEMMSPSLPVMEVEELEVINIELSDYPLPENPTTYDWWWA